MAGMAHSKLNFQNRNFVDNYKPDIDLRTEVNPKNYITNKLY